MMRKAPRRRMPAVAYACSMATVLATVAVLSGPPPAAGASAADRRSAARAAAWLAGEPPGRLPAGQQADVMVSMRITGTPARALQARLRAMQRVAPGYAVSAGATAKVVLGATAAGGNPRRLAGTDYLAKLRAQQTAPGRYGRTAFDQGLAMIALRAATGRVTAAAVNTLVSRHTGAGWNLGLEPAGDPDVDSTALSVVALRAAGIPCTSPAIRTARAWLKAQRRDGGWAAYPGPPSANSTALVARADIACGGRAIQALTVIRGLQQRSGAIAYTRANPESRVLASTESVPALVGVSLAQGFPR
jgi:hypothetical protein